MEAKVLIFPPNLKISFIDIVLFWPCRAHSDRCCFAKKMIWRRSIRSISRPSDSGSRGTKDVEFIRCGDGQEPQIHKMWCLGSDNITRKIHPTAQVEVGAGTVGRFTTNYLAKNGRIIPIIRKLSINGCVQILVISNFSEIVDCCLLKTRKLPLCPLVGDTLIPSTRTR